MLLIWNSSRLSPAWLAFLGPLSRQKVTAIWVELVPKAITSLSRTVPLGRIKGAVLTFCQLLSAVGVQAAELAEPSETLLRRARAR